MNVFEIIGLIATILTTAASIPQVWKIFTTKQTRDISLWMYVMYAVGNGFWIIYGFYMNSFQIYVGNIISLCFSSAILIYKIINIAKGIDPFGK